MKSYVVFDLETTGLNPYSNSIIELGAIKVTPSGEEHFSTMVKPRHEIEPKALETHGITKALAFEKGITGREALEKFRQFAGNLPLVAQNGYEFDYHYLVNEAIFHGVSLGANPMLDTKVIADKMGTPVGKANLIALCQRFGVPFEHKHRALNDTLGALAVFKAQVQTPEGALAAEEQLTGRKLSELQAMMNVIVRAIERKESIEIDYSGKKKPRSVRTVTPRLVEFPPRQKLTLIAFCHSENIEKNFTLSSLHTCRSLENKKAG